jgi:hypothetical protein
MPEDLLRALIDPTAPLPAGWPAGMLGVFMLFMLPVGGGIPFGVLMARDAGISPLVTVGLYFVSDVLLAFVTEPFVSLLRWLSARVPVLARAGKILGRLTGTAGLQDDGVRGPLGLILVAFSISPTTGRAAAAAAGHGFVPGWTFAIIGDMLYFGLLMASTLWVSSLFGDERLTIGAVLIGTWVLPLAIRRLRRRKPQPTRTQPARVVTASATLASVPAGAAPASALPRRRSTAGTRRRSARGLHR